MTKQFFDERYPTQIVAVSPLIIQKNGTTYTVSIDPSSLEITYTAAPLSFDTLAQLNASGVQAPVNSIAYVLLDSTPANNGIYRNTGSVPSPVWTWVSPARGIDGTNGTDGTNGLPGSNGTNGSTIIQTTGAPSSGAGNNGDYAIDTSAKMLYGPKSGTWPAGVSLQGDAGANSVIYVPAAGGPANFAISSALPANTYNNGAGTITGNANGALSSVVCDGVTPTVGMRCWIWDATGATGTNVAYGLYVVTQVGSAGTPFILTRATDANTAGKLGLLATGVLAGSTNVNKLLGVTLPSGSITLGTTAIPIALVFINPDVTTEASLRSAADVTEATARAAADANLQAQITAANAAALSLYYAAPVIWRNILDGYAPTLAADFVRAQYILNGAGALITDILSFSTPAKWVLGSNGIWTQSSVNGPSYDSVLGTLMLLIEADSATNVVLYNRDLTNAAWVKTNCTAAKDQTGIDNVSNAASSVTATASNATILQTITLASSQQFQSAFVKRITGSGAVSMTMDGGATWTALTLTSSWVRLPIPAQTLANPSVGFKIATSGDAIAVDFVQNEAGAAWTSPIATTSTAVTRTADDVRLTSPALALLNSAKSFVARLNNPGRGSGTRYLIGAPSWRGVEINTPDATYMYSALDDASHALNSATTTGTAVNVAAAWDSSGRSVSVNGATPTSDAYGLFSSESSIRFGAHPTAGYAMPQLYLASLALHSVQATSGALQDISRI